MSRRDFLRLVSGVAASWSLVASAQYGPVPVIGFLGSTSATSFGSQLTAFRQGLGTNGFVEGQNVAVEYRWAESRYDRLPELAADLVRRQVAVIATSGGALPALAAKTATTSIPIVFTTGSDPISDGLVTSLSRPEGNVTGVTSTNAATAQKRLELVRELIPTTAAIATLINPNSASADIQLRDIEAACRALGLNLHVLRATTEQDLEKAFDSLKQLSTSALVISTDAFFISQLTTLAQLASLHRVPSIFQFRDFAMAGGLMSYGTSLTDNYRQSGIYVGRILKGEHPRDLPVQQLSKVELIINLRTAKALGIAVPLTILGRADEVIE
jgi:ABC-type uncharacterized transport system substrate-binding protein